MLIPRWQARRMSKSDKVHPATASSQAVKMWPHHPEHFTFFRSGSRQGFRPVTAEIPGEFRYRTTAWF